ncbi:hypothetical protein MTR67_012769 [Solanum verrucosum]|uniref:Uncharacterized protein n=1 Tax=Solanum verrucosum TaxID=315347 RepID=A0AAF0QGA3_SOLVR|nr:hypothetical protein MTR67_012769 [Solanum verrucosum]
MEFKLAMSARARVRLRTSNGSQVQATSRV